MNKHNSVPLRIFIASYLIIQKRHIHLSIKGTNETRSLLINFQLQYTEYVLIYTSYDSRLHKQTYYPKRCMRHCYGIRVLNSKILCYDSNILTWQDLYDM